MQSMEHQTSSSSSSSNSSSSSWLLRTHFSRSVCYLPSAETSLIINSSNQLSGATAENYHPAVDSGSSDRTHPSCSSGTRASHSRRAAAIFHIEPVASIPSSDHIHRQSQAQQLYQRESLFPSLPASPAAQATAPAFGYGADAWNASSFSTLTSSSTLCPPSPTSLAAGHQFMVNSTSNSEMAATQGTSSSSGAFIGGTKLPRLRSMLKSLSHPPTKSSSYSSLINEHNHYRGTGAAASGDNSPATTSPRTGVDSPDQSPRLQLKQQCSPKLSLNPAGRPVFTSTPLMKPSASVDSCMYANNVNSGSPCPAAVASGGHRRVRVADADSLVARTSVGMRTGDTLPHVASPAHNRLFRRRRHADGSDARMRASCSDKWLDDLSLLLLGERFAFGSHSRLYHGIYKDSPVAVKIIRRPDDDDVLAHRIEHLFFQEVTVLSCLDHRNIIKLLAACKKPPALFVITEYLPGGSLRAFLNKNWQQQQQQQGENGEPRLQALSEEKAVAMAIDVARGMEYLHAKGIVHRDLKSENLVIAEDGCLKIVDFGVSCFESELRGCVRQHDDGGGGDDVGTYRWMAPELLSHKPHSRKVDVYSFGIVLWELLTMRLPYEGMSPVQAAFSVVHQNRRPPIPADCPRMLVQLLERCWSGQPDSRPEFREISRMLIDYHHRAAASPPKMTGAASG